MSKEKILKELKQMEKINDIKIIFAIESGSRIWRMDSKDSDYDIRFVFKRPFKEYLQLSKPKDVIDSTHGNRDYLGFDIYKFCGLLHATNPSAIEWIQSDIIYLGSQPIELIRMIHKFNPLSLFHHYKSMCRQNYLSYIKSGRKVTYKKYLYAMRGLVNSEYVKEMYNLPPISFIETLDYLENSSPTTIPKHIIHRLRKIIKLKKVGKEKAIVKNDIRIDSFIESRLKDSVQPLPRRRHETLTVLNDYLLEEVYNAVHEKKQRGEKLQTK